MNNEQQDVLHAQLNPEFETTTDNNELLHKEKIDGSPLWIIGEPTTGYFVAMGKYRLTEKVTKLETARLLPYSNMWEIIINIIAVISNDVVIKTLGLDYEEQNS